MQQPLKPYNHPDYNDLPAHFPPDCASAWGEDQYGVWFELSVKHVVQRFRWIPKGEFTMGSSEDEKERESPSNYGKETLHEITVSSGYWLADTVCSQDLWQVVLRDNPSWFKEDSLNPVERVSWLDIQTFLKQLNQLIPNLKVQLPRETQWEYACRAGTTTPFYFGENITTDQVNYGGDHPYSDGKKGVDRGKTVPVKSFDPNQWGVYQMHGNVWEWCLDKFNEDLGELVEGAITSHFVVGAMSAKDNLVNTSSYVDGALRAEESTGKFRALRGGSWAHRGKICRSAARYAYLANESSHYIGFRLILNV